MRFPADARATRTDLAMLASGQWARVARKHYRHASGVEIVYRPNQYLWEVRGGARDGNRWETLEPARYYVERGFSRTGAVRSCQPTQ